MNGGRRGRGRKRGGRNIAEVLPSTAGVSSARC